MDFTDAIPKPIQLTEVARSYSRKVNLGNYESMDFFCSQKLEVPLDQAEAASERLIQFCRSQVTKDIQAFMAERKKS